MRRRAAPRAALLLLPILALQGCQRSERLPYTGVDAGGLDAAQRRWLLAQVVDDPRVPEECGILEGRAYKYLLRLCARIKEGRLNDAEDKEATFEHLQDQPGLFRGHVVVCRESVVIEVAKADLGPEYGLPGYAVLAALLVNSARELYELRILSPPGSTLYEKLQAGIEEEKNPVLQATGYFLKNHAKLTSDPKEPPWRRPLLVAPEPSFNKLGKTYNAWRDLVDNRLDKLLPSKALPGPKAEERLVVEVLPAAGGAAELHAEGLIFSPSAAEPLGRALAACLARLPATQKTAPSAVVFLSRGAPAGAATEALALLRQAGIQRLFMKDENESLRPPPPAPRK